MMYCLNCGKTFDEEELISMRESAGECHGVPSYFTYFASPCCGSDDFINVEDMEEEEGEE